jgi:Ca2+-transporting ATPase
MAEVTATGAASEIGKIGQSLGTFEREPPKLQAQTRRVVWVFAIAGGAVSVLAVLLYGLLRGGWLDALLGGIALGMSMLPEELPVVLAVFMAMGAWRISRARVLTRRAAAIETLGSATVLCTDKTGTLTENRMSVAGCGSETARLFDRTKRPARTLAWRSATSSNSASSPVRQIRSIPWRRHSTSLLAAWSGPGSCWAGKRGSCVPMACVPISWR